MWLTVITIVQVQIFLITPQKTPPTQSKKKKRKATKKKKEKSTGIT